MCVEDNRYTKHDGKGVIILAPSSGNMRSYHAGGKSAGEVYRDAWRKAKCIREEFRL